MPKVAASGSAVSRRVSEVVGVALFAAALIWLIALATYDPSDPVWFFSTGTHDVPANFAGRVGADRKSTRLNSSHVSESRMPSSA